MKGAPSVSAEGCLHPQSVAQALLPGSRESPWLLKGEAAGGVLEGEAPPVSLSVVLTNQRGHHYCCQLEVFPREHLSTPHAPQGSCRRASQSRMSLDPPTLGGKEGNPPHCHQSQGLSCCPVLPHLALPCGVGRASCYRTHLL